MCVCKENVVFFLISISLLIQFSSIIEELSLVRCVTISTGSRINCISLCLLYLSVSPECISLLEMSLCLVVWPVCQCVSSGVGRGKPAGSCRPLHRRRRGGRSCRDALNQPSFHPITACEAPDEVSGDLAKKFREEWQKLKSRGKG